MNHYYWHFTIMVVITWCVVVKGDVKFCFNEDYQVITSSKKSWVTSPSFAHHCPHGLLFEDPVEVATVGRLRSGLCVTENICDFDLSICDRGNDDQKIFQAQYLTGNFTLNENLEIFDEIEPVPDDLHCTHGRSDNSIEEVKENGVLSRKKRTTPGETKILSNDTITNEIIDETRLLFYFLTRINTEDVRSKHRVVSLLGPSMEVIKRRCDPSKLDPMFMDTIHEAMLFLIKQEGTSNLEEISADEAVKLSEALKRCSHGTHPIKIHGSECLDTIHHVSHEKNGQYGVENYIFDEKYTFQWGMYDPVVDALWLAIDIIHGLCHYDFAKFDLQHKYLTAMTEIFLMKKIFDRWPRPTPLVRQETYDHIFLAPMNQSLNILDACNIGAYIHSPYPHRSLREINSRKRRIYRKKLREEGKQQTSSSSSPPLSRVKRSIEAEANNQQRIDDDYTSFSSSENFDSINLEPVAYCLQTEWERDEKVNYLKKSRCREHGYT